MAITRSYLLNLAIALFLAIGHTAVAQVVPDSLLENYRAAVGDSAKARALLAMGESIEAQVPDQSMKYYNDALQLSNRIKNNDCQFVTWINIGNCYIELNKMDSAIVGFEQATIIARVMKDSAKVGRAIANLGNVYLHKNDRERAMNNYLYAAGLWETSGERKYLPVLYSNINALLEEQKEHTKALEYANKSVALAKELKDTLSLIDGLINMSTSYNHLDQLEKSYSLLQEALLLANTSGDVYQLVTINNNMGDYFVAKKIYNEALKRFLTMYDYTKEMNNKYFMSSASFALAKVYHELKQDEPALQYIRQAESLAGEVGERAELKEIYSIRAQIEESAGHYQLSASYYFRALKLGDSLFKATSSEKIAEAEARYQNEKKEKEILSLQHQKTIQSLSIRQQSMLNYLLAGSLIAVLLVGFFAYRNFKTRQLLTQQQGELQQQQINELEKDKQLVAVDAMLKGQEEERSRVAKDLHDGLGGLLSGIKFSFSNMKDNLIVTQENMAVLERSMDMIDTSIKELRRVAHNLMPEMLSKFGLDEALKEYSNAITATKLITVRYQSHGLDNNISKSTEIILYRIIQELLNNVLKHANASEVFVQVVKEETRLSVMVEDNGKGFVMNPAEPAKGAGLANVKSRVEYLKGVLDINAQPGKGTLVNMEFKLDI